MSAIGALCRTLAKSPLYLLYLLRFLVAITLQILTLNYFCGRLHCRGLTDIFPPALPMPYDKSWLETGSSQSAGVSVRVPGFQELQELPVVALPM
jgi:hypothetical protein